MVSQESVTYIKDSLQKGVSPEIITSNLLKSGWKEADIIDALKQIENQGGINASIPNVSSSIHQTPQINVSTPSETNVEFEYAGYFRRIFGLMVDLFLISLTVTFLYLFLFRFGFAFRNYAIMDYLFFLGHLILPFLFILFTFFYFVLSWGVWKGFTIGNRIFGIQVIRTNGKSPHIGIALLRLFVGFILTFITLIIITIFSIFTIARFLPFGTFISPASPGSLAESLLSIILNISFISLLWDSNKQALHDKVARTYVVKTAEKRKKYIIFVVIYVAILFGLLFLAYIASVIVRTNYTDKQYNEDMIIPTTTPLPTLPVYNSSDASGWKIYDGELMHFKYPANLNVRTDSTWKEVDGVKAEKVEIILGGQTRRGITLFFSTALHFGAAEKDIISKTTITIDNEAGTKIVSRHNDYRNYIYYTTKEKYGKKYILWVEAFTTIDDPNFEATVDAIVNSLKTK